MKKLVAIIFTSVLLLGSAKAADDQFNLKFGGYVKSETVYDTRQMTSAREGHFSLMPDKEILDSKGDDVNDAPQFNMFAIQTRMFVKADGPGLFGGKSTAYIEGEFFGNTEESINMIRMRHAYVDLDWDNFQVKAGQTWHPFFPADCVPDVISFNTGVPFIPFSRTPQLRLTQKFNAFRISVAALTERDFASNGPASTSSRYLRNSGIPELTFGIYANYPAVSFGVTGGIKSLKPYQVLPKTPKMIKTEETVNSYAASGYFKLVLDKFQFKYNVIYGTNLTNVMQIGGYAVKTLDTANGLIEYTASKTMSVMGELMYRDGWEIGVLAGFSKNMGYDDNYRADLTFGRSLDVEQLIRISPRFAYTYNKTKFGLELEYMTATYGVPNYQDKGKFENTYNVSNLRLLFGIFVNF